MGRFDISPEVAEEYAKKFREAAEPFVDEKIEAVGNFKRTGSGTRFAISKTQVGALAYGASSMLSKKKAGGLPGSFLLVVTPKKLVALEYKTKGRGVKVKGEAGSWDRSDVRASADDSKRNTRLTLEAGEDKIVCEAEGMGDNPWADSVIRELGA